MIFSNLGTIVKAANFLDTNISMIEKMENRYKLKRKVSNWTVIPISMVLIIAVSFFLSKYVNGYLATVSAFLIYITFTIISTRKIKKENIEMPRRYIFIIITLWLIMVYFYIINFSLEFYRNQKSIFSQSFLLFLMVIFIGYVLSYSFIVMLNELLEKTLSSFFKNVYLNIEMINGELLNARLITITKKGDFIVNMSTI
ncbi:hypothetical protein MKY98_08480 [Paenibacillus sp. FSL M8-0228]|nr:MULTISPECIES: hypothetical protein [Paenibacillus]MBO3283970.1 hypothetical protein [Paenibacillus polymyxa]MBP1310977.1 putative neutral ceramidase superfamily lipid hydrolase [Paenibacillus sp. 1182]